MSQVLSHNPDVLDCIANLSNDEVFTPPKLAREMLDNVAAAWAEDHGGENIWTNPNVTFLDPVTKSGVFLREITSRLVDGLSSEIPDLQDRVNHVLKKQVFGVAITNLTGMLARRSVYCSKWANRKYSVCTSFDTDEGNIWFERTEHTWIGGKREIYLDPVTGEDTFRYRKRRCQYCGASEDSYARGDALESHAYAFIHTDNIRRHLDEIFGDSMQFDVVIGNPPYQLSDAGHGASAAPIYHYFVQKALELEPRYASFITPSRWFAGGKGLDEFRKEMLGNHKIRSLVDYPKLYEAFPGVKIRGGVSYFLWSREYDGPCSIQTICDGKPLGEPVERYLDQFDVLVRSNQAIPILQKVLSAEGTSLEHQVSSRKPFGLATNFKGKSTAVGIAQPVKLFANQRQDWVDRSELLINDEWVDDWKVLMTRVQGTSAAVETMFLSRPIVAEPGTACTETYLVAGHFSSESEARSLASYLRTRFVRFLVSLRKSTQDAPRHVYSFVPAQTWDREWTDEKLYEKYGIDTDEIAFIESIVKPMESE